MKKLIFFSLMILASGAWAKEVTDFNQVLIDGVKKDIKKDDYQFRHKQPLGRVPASVSEEIPQTQEDQKIDKMNIRQIGPNKW